MKTIGKLYLYILLLFSPFLAFYIDVNLNLIPYYLIGTLTSILALLFLFRRNLLINNIILLYVLLFIYYFVWSFFNERYDKFGLVKILFKSLTLHTIGFLIINTNLHINKKNIIFLIKGIKILIILSAIFSFIQLFFNPYFFNSYLTTTNFGLRAFEIRNWSIWGFLDPNDVGLSFLAFVAIAVSYDLLNKKKSLYIWLLLGALVSFATNARYVMLNMILIIIFIYSLGNYRFKLVKLSLFSIVAVFLLNFAFSKLSYTPEEYFEGRLLSKSAESRIYAIDLFKKYYTKSPWFGSGLRVTKDLAQDISGISSQIHVGYLSHLFEFGIIGSSILFTIWILILKNFYINARKSRFYGSFIAFLCFLIANLALVEYSIFHVGLLFAFVFDKYYRNYPNESSAYLKAR